MKEFGKEIATTYKAGTIEIFHDSRIFRRRGL